MDITEYESRAVQAIKAVRKMMMVEMYSEYDSKFIFLGDCEGTKSSSSQFCHEDKGIIIGRLA